MTWRCSTSPATVMATVMATTEPSVPGYRLLERIGRGGLGDVYRAIRDATGETVAVKILRDVSDSSVAWHRTRRELAALTALGGHPHVIQPIELLELEEGPALVMEHAPGGSVADLIDRRSQQPPMTVDEVVFVGRQTAAALVATHARGIVHRDIKPQNLLITADGRIKLCDFGIAALTADEQYRTRTNAVSMRYASPEDLEHDQEVGLASDIYSLGATLLHLAHGAPPTLKDRLAPWVPPPASEARLAALDRVIARCLQPNPAVRPAADGVLAALDGLALGAGIDGVESLSVSNPVERPDRDQLQYDGDATTIARGKRLDDPIPDRVPVPEPPRPQHDLDRRRRLITAGVMIATGLAVVAVLAMLAFQPESPGRSQAGGETTVPPVTTVAPVVPAAGPTVVPRPIGLIALTEVDWSAGPVGDCLVQTDASALQVVACDTAHDLQRFAEGTLAGELAAAGGFDADAVAAAVTAACAQALLGFVGSSAADTTLDLAQTRPNQATWAGGDRAYACYLGRTDSRIIGDARTSGW
jgi:hypothetical protein